MYCRLAHCIISRAQEEKKNYNNCRTMPWAIFQCLKSTLILEKGLLLRPFGMAQGHIEVKTSFSFLKLQPFKSSHVLLYFCIFRFLCCIHQGWRLFFFFFFERGDLNQINELICLINSSCKQKKKKTKKKFQSNHHWFISPTHVQSNSA